MSYIKCNDIFFLTKLNTVLIFQQGCTAFLDQPNKENIFTFKTPYFYTL